MAREDINNTVVLCIGSNLKPRRDNVKQCISWLQTLLQESKFSEIYETPEIHGIGAPYANAVLLGNTTLEYKELDGLLKQYEVLSGRNAEARRKMIVPIDIDIVIWNNEVVRDKDFRQSFFQIGFRNLNETMQHNELEIMSNNYLS